MRAHKDYHDTKVAMTRLWIHEAYRVFYDRLIDDKDKEAFVQIITEKLGLTFDQTFHNICPNKQPPIFGDYINVDNVYEDINDMEVLKKHMNDTLGEYNATPGIVQQNLVLFRDAIEHGTVSLNPPFVVALNRVFSCCCVLQCPRSCASFASRKATCCSSESEAAVGRA